MSTDICSVCRRHRSACICVSHVDLPQPADTFDPMPADLVRGLVGAPVPASQVDGMVQHAMQLYYGRDAVGLERLIRSWFP